MKKIASIALLALLSSAAFAGSGDCQNGTGAATKKCTAAQADFVAVAFDYSVSASVNLYYLTDTTSASVQAASVKGKNIFGGTTNGGSVQVCTTGTTAAAPGSTSSGC